MLRSAYLKDVRIDTSTRVYIYAICYVSSTSRSTFVIIDDGHINECAYNTRNFDNSVIKTSQASIC